ncbi:replication initiation protein [Shewanella sp. OPT22]|nr:replication initiation protein [Shewanella sp. OPT22]
MGIELKGKRRILFLCVILALLLFIPTDLKAESSICYGTTANGNLTNGVQLPADGDNFVGYSRIARLAGRTYVHSAVRNIILSSYQHLKTELPHKVFKYAETGFKSGGKFKPHKTHQNGLSVDFMTPVLDEKGNSVHLSTSPFNRFGYDIEFDSKGRYEDLTIDYVGLAAHITALHKNAKSQGYDVWRVIFAPNLQPKLFDTEYGHYLKKHVQFSTKRSWVRHDEHYHVDFKVPCK